MKRFTFLLTMLFALVFGQSAFAQVGVKLSDDNVKYEYYIKRLLGSKYVTAKPSTSNTSLTLMDATTDDDGYKKVKFYFVENSSGSLNMYATNIHKNSSGEFEDAPVLVWAPSAQETYTDANGKQQSRPVNNYYIGSSFPAYFSLTLVKASNGDYTGKYALAIETKKASGPATFSNNSWGEAAVDGVSYVRYFTNTTGQYFIWAVEAATPAPMVFSSSAKGTLATYSTPLEATIPDGVTAYKAESNAPSEGVLALTQLTGTTIPAGEGVILEITAEEGLSSAVVYPETGSGSTETSALSATTQAQSSAALTTSETVTASATGSIVVTKDDGYNYYGLGSYTDSETNTSVQAFLPFSEETTITMVPYKAYLKTSSTSGSIKLQFPDGSTTSINGVNVGEKISNAAIYDLSGRRVNATAKGGLYIQNGKKFIAE